MKKMIHILIFILLSMKMYSTPDVQCIEVLANGDIVISWLPPSDPLNEFDSYHIFFSPDKSASFVAIDSIFNYSQTTYTHDNFNGQNDIGYYYIKVRKNIGGTFQYSNSSDTLASILLKVNNIGNNTANLSWNPIHAPQINAYNEYFYIYQSYAGGSWQFIDSTLNLSYNHTVIACNKLIAYQIRQQNNACISVSSIDEDVFIDVVPPDIPKFDTVSINKTTQLAELGWQAGNDPDIIGYIIYKNISGIWSPIDTLAGTFYTDNSSTANITSESYRIASLDSCGNTSPMSSIHNSIFLSHSNTTCSPYIELSWTPYINMNPSIDKYVVYTSIDGQAYTQDAILSSTQTTYQYSIAANNNNYNICFYVSAKSQDDSQSASSNIICDSISRPPQPQFAYIPYVTIIDNEAVEIALHNDINVNVKGYKLEKSIDGGLNFTHLTTLGTQGTEKTTYIDYDVQVSEKSYTYKYSVIDACGLESLTSNTSSTILLNGKNLEELYTTQLDWSQYNGWDEGVESYQIFRKSNSTTNAINLADLPKELNTYIDNIENEIITGNDQITYYIQAVQADGNIFGYKEQSVSNEVNIEQTPRIFIPNAFTPNGLNPTFKPSLVFVSSEGYQFTIYNRWGQIMFETNNINDAWDGKTNGVLVSQDSYIYIIQAVFANGTNFKKRGLITVIH